MKNKINKDQIYGSLGLALAILVIINFFRKDASFLLYMFVQIVLLLSGYYIYNEFWKDRIKKYVNEDIGLALGVFSSTFLFNLLAIFTRNILETDYLIGVARVLGTKLIVVYISALIMKKVIK
jgi:hypothetical protein